MGYDEGPKTLSLLDKNEKKNSPKNNRFLYVEVVARTLINNPSRCEPKSPFGNTMVLWTVSVSGLHHTLSIG